jgi:hypothetical protein
VLMGRMVAPDQQAPAPGVDLGTLFVSADGAASDSDASEISGTGLEQLLQRRLPGSPQPARAAR